MSSEAVLSTFEAARRDLESEREELDLLIEGMRRRIARASGNPAPPASRPATSGGEQDIPFDAFFRMTIGDAARKYLEITKQPRSTSEIGTALERGGLKHSSKDFGATLRVTLAAKPEFTRVNG